MSEQSKESPDRAEEKDRRSGDQTAGEKKTYALPKIDFSTFIFSINSSALVQLGLIEDPEGGKTSKNLPMAKQTIDLLAMLEEKTRGNLTSDEEQMLKNIIYELRMLYVKERG